MITFVDFDKSTSGQISHLMLGSQLVTLLPLLLEIVKHRGITPSELLPWFAPAEIEGQLIFNV
jgi:hypothetical protein